MARIPRVWEELIKLLSHKEIEDRFTSKEVASQMGRSQATIYPYLKALVEIEFLAKFGGGSYIVKKVIRPDLKW